MADLSSKTDVEIDTWIANHERNKKTDSELFRELLEERAKRQSKLLNIEKSLQHLIACAKLGRGHFTTYGALADVSGVPWSKARHSMNGSGGHLDNLLDVCHARKLPLLTALCVNQQGVATGTLEPSALRGFANGAKRLGYPIFDEREFLEACQNECFEWAQP
jgi:hypothetical protein